LRFKEEALRSLFEAPMTSLESDHDLSMLIADKGLRKSTTVLDLSDDDEAIEDMPLLKQSAQKDGQFHVDSDRSEHIESLRDVTVPVSMPAAPMSTALPSEKKMVETEVSRFSWKSFFFHLIYALFLSAAAYFLYPLLDARRDEILQYILLM
jgi:hypothetical protein